MSNREQSGRQHETRRRAPRERSSGPRQGLAPTGTPAAHGLVLALLAAATFATFAGAIANDWLLYDDPQYVTANPHVNTGLTLDGMRWFLVHPHAGNWHPLTSWSHMLDVQLFGLAPAGPHAMNLVLHALNAVLLVWVLFRLTGAWWRSTAVAALFALHPLRVESVAWVAERKDLLSGLFFLLTLAAYRHWVDRPSRSRYAILVLAFGLGLMSKPMLVTLPFVLLLLDVWPLGRLQRTMRAPEASTVRAPERSLAGLVAEKWPLFVVAACSAVVTFAVQRGAGAVASTSMIPWARRLPNALLSVWVYIGNLVWPVGLSVFYPYPRMVIVAGAAFAGLATVAVTAVALRRAPARPYFAVGWLWYLAMLLPVLGIVQVGGQAHADRYTYLPTIGLLVVLVWWVGDAVRNRPALVRIAAGATVVALVALALATVRQVAVWRNTYTLFTHALAVTHDNPTAHNYVGYALYQAGKPAEAAPHFAETLRLSPDYPEARNFLAASLGAAGRYDEAAAEFRALLAQHETADLHFNLGMTYELAGHHDRAVSEWEAALRLDPQHAPSRAKLAGAPSPAPAAARATPTSGPPGPSAIETARAAAVTAVEGARIDDAIRDYEAILRLDANDLDALNNLAWIRATHADPAHRNGKEAVRLAERARDHAPEPAAVLYSTLAASYAEAGRYPEAVAAGQLAVDLARRANSSAEAERYAQQLALYRAGRPFHFTR